MLLRYWHTARHLRPVQIYRRVWFRAWRPRPDLAPPPPVRADGTAPWVLPARRAPSLTADGQFVFLSQSGSLQEIGWDGLQREKLWRYNQHYFNDLNAREAEQRALWHRALIKSWVDCNPAALGTGWEPYPLSLRIVNWVKWARAGNALSTEAIHSLAVQARWLTRRLEFHLLGNHLCSNAKALLFASAFFTGPEADRWRALAINVLQRELREQSLPDGGHFERSTMYHALFLEDLLDICNILQCHADTLGEPAARLRERCAALGSKAVRWLDTMCHPDGDLAFFNDAAFGVAPHPDELRAYARRLGLIEGLQGLQTTWLETSGYARLQVPAAVAFLDMAPVGPEYLPGHAHADTLSFELSVYGQRVFVNSGTSCYGVSEERLRQRGTAAHNTVLVDGRDSTEVWSGFRVARRAKPRGARVVGGTPGARAECSHDGYTRLPGSPIHRRIWTLEATEMHIVDEVPAALPAQARFHLHPAVHVEAEPGGRCGTLRLPAGEILVWRCERGSVHLEPTTWHPEFGISRPTTCLCIDLLGGGCSLTLRWSEPIGSH